MTSVDLAVVGGGITGLAAAWEAKQHGADVVVLEAESVVGGKLRTSPVAGLRLDESADAFLARVPEAVTLCSELGIADELVSPASPSRAYVFVNGRLRALPENQLLGVPTELDELASSGLVSSDGVERAREDLHRADDRPEGDEAVADLVRRRLGDEVLDTLVAPLVGGIWAGDCDRLSLATATPGLMDARNRGPSLIRAATEIRAAAATTDRPVFLAPRGGMARLVEVLVERLGDTVRPQSPVSGLTRGPGGTWRVEPFGISADAVVVATPAYAAATLVGAHAPTVGETLAAVEHASVALVALVYDRANVDDPLDGSGFLVPPSSGRVLTACSWATSKWPHLGRDAGADTVVLRASAGRDGDERALQMDDEALVSALVDDLAATTGVHGRPTEVRVNRWMRSFPQPRPGHLDRVARIEADLARDAPGLVVAGAWARGVGIPACIRAGREGTATALRTTVDN